MIDQDFFIEGSFIPWYNYKIIEFLNKQNLKNLEIFEFGCGYSTLFYAQKSKFVTSIESRFEWQEKILNLAELNNLSNLKITLHNKLFGVDFASSIKVQDRNFDLIVCDSFDRVNCVRNSLQKVSNDGVILLDNSERDKYQIIFKEMLDLNWYSITFSDLGPCRIKPSSSTIFYKKYNILNL
jgi:hypothetical protein